MLKFPYGKGFLELDVPEANLASVVEPRFGKAAENPKGEIVRALNNPIGSGRVEDLIKREDVVVLIVSDITRPAPNQLMVPPVIETLRRAGLKGENLETLVANGLHRSPSRREMEELLGKRVLEEVPVVNHNARNDEQLVEVGRTSFGTRVTLNRRVVKADSVIITGLIEPHFFAGYSGGRKSVFPGVAGAESTFQNHSFRMIGHPKARYGILGGNPIHEDSVEAARLVKPKFMVNVVVNKERQVILQRAEVIVVSKGVKDTVIEDMLMTPASTPEEALNLALRKTGKNAKIVVVPEGPFIIPYISSHT